jgi:hypothetical protein
MARWDRIRLPLSVTRPGAAGPPQPKLLRRTNGGLRSARRPPSVRYHWTERRDAIHQARIEGYTTHQETAGRHVSAGFQSDAVPNSCANREELISLPGSGHARPAGRGQEATFRVGTRESPASDRSRRDQAGHIDSEHWTVRRPHFVVYPVSTRWRRRLRRSSTRLGRVFLKSGQELTEDAAHLCASGREQRTFYAAPDIRRLLFAL